jgi:hypothetical protein
MGGGIIWFDNASSTMRCWVMVLFGTVLDGSGNMDTGSCSWKSCCMEAGRSHGFSAELLSISRSSCCAMVAPVLLCSSALSSSNKVFPLSSRSNVRLLELPYVLTVFLRSSFLSGVLVCEEFVVFRLLMARRGEDIGSGGVYVSRAGLERINCC